jgi:hypothetical protein
VLPVAAELYWFVADARRAGTIRTPYCITIVAVLILVINYRFIWPFFLRSVCSTTSDGGGQV